MTDRLTETVRRRTFAIISHPDAGKTTMTEKVLLFGGRNPACGHGQRAQSRSPRYFRLDDDGKRARHFRYLFGDAVPLQRAYRQPARHAGA